jgi:hypothetical protein
MAIIPGAQNQNFSFDPQQAKQKNLFYILGALILATGAVVYFGFLKKPNIPSLESLEFGGGQQVEGAMIDSLERINFQKAILDDEKFRELSMPVKLPLTINPDEKGRNNPFVSF